MNFFTSPGIAPGIYQDKFDIYSTDSQRQPSIRQIDSDSKAQIKAKINRASKPIDRKK